MSPSGGRCPTRCKSTSSDKPCAHSRVSELGPGGGELERDFGEEVLCPRERHPVLSGDVGGVASYLEPRSDQGVVWLCFVRGDILHLPHR